MTPIRPSRWDRAFNALGDLLTKRLTAIQNWSLLVGSFANKTVIAAVRFPIYGLLGVEDKLPPLFESIIKVTALPFAIAGLLAGGLGGLVIAGVFGQEPTRFFASAGRSETRGSFIADYLNDSYIRTSVMRYGALGFIATGAFLALVGFVAALNAGMTVGMSLAAVVTVMPITLPAMLSVAGLGAAFCFARGVTHKWHIDGINDQVNKLRELLGVELEGAQLKGDSSVYITLANLANEARYGEANAYAQLMAFNVKGAVQKLVQDRSIAEKTSELSVQIAQTNAQLNKVEMAIQAVASVADEQAGSIKSLFVKDDKTQVQVENLVTKITAMSKTDADKATRLSVIEADTAQLKKGAATLQANTAKLEAGVLDIISSVTKVTNQLQKAFVMIGADHRYLTEVQKLSLATASASEANKQQLEAVKGDQVEFSAALSDISQALTAVKEDSSRHVLESSDRLTSVEDQLTAVTTEFKDYKKDWPRMGELSQAQRSTIAYGEAAVADTRPQEGARARRRRPNQKERRESAAARSLFHCS